MDSKNYLRLANRLAHFVSFAAQKIEKAKKQCLAKNMVRASSIASQIARREIRPMALRLERVFAVGEFLREEGPSSRGQLCVLVRSRRVGGGDREGKVGSARRAQPGSGRSAPATKRALGKRYEQPDSERARRCNAHQTPPELPNLRGNESSDGRGEEVPGSLGAESIQRVLRGRTDRPRRSGADRAIVFGELLDERRFDRWKDRGLLSPGARQGRNVAGGWRQSLASLLAANAVSRVGVCEWRGEHEAVVPCGVVRRTLHVVYDDAGLAVAGDYEEADPGCCVLRRRCRFGVSLAEPWRYEQSQGGVCACE